MRWVWLLIAVALPVQAAFFDFSSYESVLARSVDDQGYVDYAAVRQNSLSALESLFERAAEADLSGWPADEKKTFWLNLYNARVLYELARQPAMRKVSEQFELFNQPFRAAGQTLSLNDIRHRILRGSVNPDNKRGPIEGVSWTPTDPRVHAVIACGALGCAPLSRRPYEARDLDLQLQDRAVAFANDARQVGWDGQQLKLSSLFKWYAADFKAAGGVAAYLAALQNDAQREDADQMRARLKNVFEKAAYGFDWRLNDVRERPEEKPATALDRPELPADAASTTPTLR